MDSGTVLSLLGLAATVLVATLGSAWALANRIGGVQTEVKHVQGEVREGFAHLRGELATTNSRIETQKEDLIENRVAHGRIHARLDDHSTKLTRIEERHNLAGHLQLAGKGGA